MSPKLVYAIGDIHGRLDLLDILLDKIKTDAGKKDYQLVFLGDYIDRGDSSKQVIDRLIELKNVTAKYPPVTLRGNHEDILMKLLKDDYDWARLSSWLFYGGIETMRSYGVDAPDNADEDKNNAVSLLKDFQKAVSPEHVEFLEGLSLTFQTATHFFCHAGIDFDLPLDRQKTDDLLWIRLPFHNDKRMAEKVIVHGHTITEDFLPHAYANRIGIDTGAFKSGNLTACVLQDREVPRFVMTI